MYSDSVGQAGELTKEESDHAEWLELTRMLSDWEDGYEPAGAFARRLISWWHGKELGRG